MGGSESTSEYQNHGFRVLNILPNSPVSKTNIRRMVDFICYEPESEEDLTFHQIIENNKNKEMKIVVYNLINQDKRIVDIIPSDNWGGKSLFGAAIRYEDYSEAERRVAFVGEVYQHSPAYRAGLKANTDYILGTEYLEIKSLEDISTLAKANINRPIDLIVYNTETQDIRDVKITPEEDWGGDGLLGCELYMGIQFTIPPSLHLYESINRDISNEQENVKCINQELESFTSSNSEHIRGMQVNEQLLEQNNEIITEVLYEEIPSEEVEQEESDKEIYKVEDNSNTDGDSLTEETKETLYISENKNEEIRIKEQDELSNENVKEGDLENIDKLESQINIEVKEIIFDEKEENKELIFAEENNHNLYENLNKISELSQENNKNSEGKICKQDISGDLIIKDLKVEKDLKKFEDVKSQQNIEESETHQSTQNTKEIKPLPKRSFSKPNSEYNPFKSNTKESIPIDYSKISKDDCHSKENLNTATSDIEEEKSITLSSPDKDKIKTSNVSDETKSDTKEEVKEKPKAILTNSSSQTNSQNSYLSSQTPSNQATAPVTKVVRTKNQHGGYML